MAEVELSDESSIVFVVARVATHMNIVIRPKMPFEVCPGGDGNNGMCPYTTSHGTPPHCLASNPKGEEA